ncbi:MAG: Coenzyme F420 hydrogenase/dehydrogenase, beta subunit C-terminal domain [Candidatus Hydrothermarchaeota archaeon]|nr:Coenzyme F420 hydrogenase/dehydrogenase, beta subunit C-terminal domain [Candidatus Hydrothermarchaeota archaeon]
MEVGLENYVPLMQPSKGFEELKKLVIDQGICSACSTCAAFCERIEMVNGMPALVKDCTLKTGSIKCSEEGTCFDTCPMVSFSMPELEKSIFGAARQDEDLGCYKKIVAVRSKIPEILEKAQDGGAVTSFLLCALENKLIEGAVVANRGEDWSTSAEIAKNKEELLSGAGTKYCRTFSVAKFGRSLRDVRKIAIVGTGCQITGARRAEAIFLKELLSKTAESEKPVRLFLIGLFCFENFPYDCLKNFLEKNYNVKMERIAKTDIKKGKFIVTTKDGQTIEKKVKEFEECVPESCKLCTNFTAEFADISVGGVGSDLGWSTVIVRSDRGMELLEKAGELGYVEIQDSINLEEIKKNVSLKKEKRRAASEIRDKEGKYIPDYGGGI